MSQFLPPEPLTERETEILKLMSDGLSNREIAEYLVIDVETVRWHTKNIYAKLGVNSRTQAVLVARDLASRPDDARRRAPPEEQRTPLPEYPTLFVGRENELEELEELLRGPDTRLITLVGPGGVGKTRLSIEVARRVADNFANGVVFVGLTTETEPEAVALAILRALTPRPQPGSAPATALRLLRPQNCLLLLDNCDHTNAEDLIQSILNTAPQVKILATSRRSLNLEEEWVRRVTGIRCPPDEQVDDIETYAAVALFVDRVRRVRGDFSLADARQCVIDICQLVEGVPLAIEMAAGWLKTLSCEDVAVEIRRNIDFLVGSQRGADERHRSMRAVFEYSWNMLDDEERGMLLKLAVFRGGFGLEAAKHIAGASLQALAGLIDKSFLYEKNPRVYEVHDLLRHYIQEQLEHAAINSLTVRSNMLSGWVSLVKGNFDRLELLAEHFLNASDLTGRAFALAAQGILAGVDEDYQECLRLCRRSWAETPSTTAPDPIVATFADLGMIIGYCGMGNFSAARAHLHAALERAQSFRSPAFITLFLPACAVLERVDGTSEMAVEYLALAFTHPASTPAWLQRWPLLMRLLDELRDELGTDDFDSAWHHGRILAPEDVASHLIARLRG
ncbi:MAG: LuxR C-terminal-related transcriptional regulator [Chloroflexota bacterium]